MKKYDTNILTFLDSDQNQIYSLQNTLPDMIYILLDSPNINL